MRKTHASVGVDVTTAPHVRGLGPGARLTTVAAVVATLLIIVGVLLARQAEQAEVRRELDRSIALAEAGAFVTDQFLLDRIHLIEVIANGPAFVSGDPVRMAQYFAVAKSSQPILDHISWVDTGGVIRASTDPDALGIDVSQRDYFRGVMETRVPFVSAGGATINRTTPGLSVAVATGESKGAITGILTLGVTLDELASLLGDLGRRLPATMIVLDRFDQTIASAPSVDGVFSIADPDLVARARADTAGLPSETRDFGSGSNTMMAFANARTGGWLISAERPSAQAIEPARRNFWVTIAGLLGLGVVSTGAAAAVGRRIDRVYAEERFARAAADTAQDRLAVLAQVGAATTMARDINGVLQAITDAVVPRLADFCIADLIDPSGGVHRGASAGTDVEKLALLNDIRERYPFDPVSLHPAAPGLREGRTHLFEDITPELLSSIARDDTHFDMIRALAAVSAIVVPLSARGQVLGALVLSMGKSGRHHNAGDLELAGGVGRRASLAIEVMVLFEAEQHARIAAEHASERMARLQDATAAVAGSSSPDEAARIVGELGARALGANAVCVQNVTLNRQALAILYTHGFPPVALDKWTTIPMSAHLPATDAIRTNAPVLLRSREELAERYPVLAAETTAVIHQARLVVPLLLEERAIGALTLAFLDCRPLTPEDTAFAMLLARQCAQAMERAQLHVTAEAAHARTARLYSIAADLGGELDSIHISEIVLAQALKAFDASAGAMLLLDDAGEWFDVVHEAGFPDRTSESWTPLNSAWRRFPASAPTPVGDAVRERRPILMSSASERIERYPHLASVSDVTGGEAAALIPILLDGHAKGAMYLIFSEERTFSGDDISFMLTLGRHCAQAIDRSRLFAAESQARTAAEAAVRLHDEFLGLAAHELRTPVTGLRGYAQLGLRYLQRGGELDSNRIRQSLEQVDRQSRRLSTLIDQLLDITRVESGRLAIEPTKINVVALVEELVASLRLAYAQHTLIVNAPETVIGWVDALRIEQVVTNLIDNAVKFSGPDSRIEVDVRTIQEQWIHISVRDHGIGIPEDQRTLIFEQFHQVRQSRHHGGLGLGLYVSRQIAEMHGGTLEVESTGDGGSRFILLVPCDPPEKHAAIFGAEGV